ncbi:MAG: hypothetical protein KBT82_09675, partial [Marinobacter sp.]|uniref:hypothetical protein n=1 Tax=Marinobacter sp. TaxID=50741 RepID=UPI001B63AF15
VSSRALFSYNPWLHPKQDYPDSSMSAAQSGFSKHTPTTAPFRWLKSAESIMTSVVRANLSFIDTK